MHTDRQTSNYTTDMTALGVTDVSQKTPKFNLEQCPHCSGKHELTECEEFQADEIQARWNIVKQHRLCHVCLKLCHMSHCQSRIVCQCGSTEDITSCCTTPLEGSEVWLNIQLAKSPIFLRKQSCLTLRKWLRDHNSRKDHEPLSSTPPIPRPLCLQESFCCMLYLSG